MRMLFYSKLSFFLSFKLLIGDYSVDYETETIMQEIIDREFSETTVVSVIHRLRFINKYDRVAVIKNGELVECDSSEVLLKADSEFQKLYDAARMNR